MRLRKKKYHVTSKIKYAFIKKDAMEKLGEAYIKQNKHDRAVSTFNDAEVLRHNAWHLVYDLYPSIAKLDLFYNYMLQEITINE